MSDAFSLFTNIFPPLLAKKAIGCLPSIHKFSIVTKVFIKFGDLVHELVMRNKVSTFGLLDISNLIP